MRYLLAGDSTVAACPPDEHPMSGWGARLASHLPPDDAVINLAKGGATTESFIAEGLWNILLRELRAGDTVVIQFGHNDQKQPQLLASSGGYRDRLSRFVDEVADAGAHPVLCTSVERRYFDGGQQKPTHGPYPNAVRRLAAERGVPLIDLTVFTRWYYEELGPDRSAQLFTPADNTHFHERGADKVASFVAASLLEIRGAHDDLRPLGLKL